MPLRSVLNGIKILDLTQNLPGPLATQILGDFGADVIKVEPLDGDPVRHYPPFIGGESVHYLLLNRNKRSLSLDLKSKAGLDIFYELVKLSKVIVTSFRPKTLMKLGIDFESLSKKNPELIYCHITGYGVDNNRTGHDLNYVGESGILSITGSKESMILPGVPIADIGGGSLPTVITILAALLKNEKKTQYLEVPITKHMKSWLTIVGGEYLAGLEEPKREKHFLSGFLPWYRIYSTSDNEYVTFAPLESKFWKNFCQTIKRNDLLDKQFDLELCSTELPVIFRQKTQKEWLNLFSKFEIPGGAINTPKQALENDDILETITQPGIGSYKIIKSPYLESSKHVQNNPAPRIGQETLEILQELGLGEEAQKYQQSNIINIFKNEEK
ncbi:MAG: CaiB/BaiF CoA transferase family protein [Candidatus Hodarchaeales archaeon]|jgi:crotonobetainyl-CoA:carnitine CoA-transferase CaiB-like acyl-CoA transferase